MMRKCHVRFWREAGGGDTVRPPIAFTNPNGVNMPADGLPMVNGTPAAYTCIPDPRQSLMPPGVTLPPQCPYHVPSDAPTPVGTWYPQYDNPHHAADLATDVAGVPGGGGTIPTPMTGFLKAAMHWCLAPFYSWGTFYDVVNPSCPSPTPGTQTPTATPTPLGVPTPTWTPWDVMRYMTAQDIPNYWAYAQYYTLQDHLFAPNRTWSLPSHLYMVSEWSASCSITGTPSSCINRVEYPTPIVNQPGPTPKPQDYPNYAWTDLTYLLNNHQVDAQGTPVAQGTPDPISWGYYKADGTQDDCPNYTATCHPVQQPYAGTVEYWNPLPFFTTVHADGTPIAGTPVAPNGQLGNIQKHTDFYNAVAAGALPAVSWIVPDLYHSDHPMFSFTDGQTFVTNVISALRTNTQYPDQWQHTAIFLAWDDWGGFFDHETPPLIDANGYGIRVPGIVISPYAKHCYIDHQPMSFDAYVRFIEDDFLGGSRLDPRTDGRPDPRLTPVSSDDYDGYVTGSPPGPVVRETAVAGNLVNDFNFSRTSFPTAVAQPTTMPTPGATITPPDATWCGA